MKRSWRIRRYWRQASLTLMMLVLVWGSAAMVAMAENAPWDDSDLDSMTPREPQGAPDSDFVRDIQGLFPSEQDTGSPSSFQDGDSSVRRMLVQGITPTPERVFVWSDRDVYRIDDEVRLYFRISRPAYVYILNVDARGDIRLIFPNSFDRDAYVNRAGTYRLPRGGNYTFRVDGPTGSEHLLLVASSQSIGFLDQLVRRGGDFPTLGSPMSTLKQFQDWVRSSRGWSASAWNSFRVERRTTSVWDWIFTPRDPQPVARIQTNATEVDLGTSVTFSAKGSYVSDGWIRHYEWDLDGDGRTDATGESVRWTYNRPGTYTARLTVEDDRGNTATASTKVVVREPRVELKISSKPSNREVYINGSYVGRTSLKHYVGPGSHEVTVIGSGGQTFTTVVHVPSGLKGVELEVSF